MKPSPASAPLLARKGLRRPFVTTVAAAAAATASATVFACGGEIATFGEGEGTEQTPTTSTPTPTNPDGGPRSEACPATRPADGSACTTAQRCTYGDCGGSPTSEATCENGRWTSYEVSCNPPPPVCPEARPVDGAGCDVAETQTCSYDDCYGTPSTQARCLDGVWQVQRMSCNPPPPQPCPASVPAFGTSCTNDPSQRCAYGSCAAGDTSTVTAVCSNGKWTGTALSCQPVDAGLPPQPLPN